MHHARLAARRRLRHPPVHAFRERPRRERASGAARPSRHLVGRARAPDPPPAASPRPPAGTRREPSAGHRRAGGGGGRRERRGALDGAPTAGPVMRNAIAPLLAARGWTDVELAARAGLDRAHVNQVKNGRALPTVATALVIARALRVPVATAFPPGSSVRRRRPRFRRKPC